MSLRWRIVAGLAVIAALVSTLAAVGAFVSTDNQLRTSVDESLVARTNDANTQPQPPGHEHEPGDGSPGFGTRPSNCPAAGSLQPASAAQLVAVDGSVITCIEGGPTLPRDQTDLDLARSSGGRGRLRTVSIGGAEYRVYTTPWHEGGAIQTARKLSEVDKVLNSLKLRLLLLGVGGVAAAALLGWVVARRIVRPVERLRDAAERIASTQDLSTTVPVDGVGEVGSLAKSFTTMVGALSSSRDQQQRLISDASHELRTPLTSLRTNVELLQRAEQLPGDQRQAILDDMHFEVGELSDLVRELVELASDRSSNDELPEAVCLADVAENVVGKARRRSGRSITIEAEGDTAVVVRQPMIERAISNLVDNALKYSNAPIVVAITGSRLEVRDHGPGIAPNDQPHVFDRFYRSAEARTESGSGLGLAIVKQIVERHGGKVWAANGGGGGAVVGFELPSA
jgi:two-component system sensor histidine kinase MprB